jgi:SPP1 gp7 family putative phage head morphogenesis protein
MINYNLSKLAAKKRDTNLPVLQDRRSTYFAILKALRSMLSAMNLAVAEHLAGYLTQQQRQMGTDSVSVADVDPGDFDSYDAIGRSAARMAAAMVSRILRAEAKRHTATFSDHVLKTLGVNVMSVVRDDDLEDYLDAAAARNAALITNIASDTMNKVKRIVIDAVINGWSLRDTKKGISDVFGVSDSRAQLIARDQTAKLTSDLNKIRHKQADIQEYVWRTSLDERVRPRHSQLEGNKYKYDEPTGAEDGLPPGQPIQCRCVAQGIVEGV